MLALPIADPRPQQTCEELLFVPKIRKFSTDFPVSHRTLDMAASNAQIESCACGFGIILRRLMRGTAGSPVTRLLVLSQSKSVVADGRLAQLARAPALQAGCRRFESCIAHFCF